MRRFTGTDFISAYCNYADNGFIPPQFNVWSALSIVAGALERRVWLPWDAEFSFFPNIYVLLVSLPGDGKSVALNRAVGMLQEVSRKTGTLNLLPTQVTEAKFIELMGHGRSFTERTSTREVIHRQNAGYYSASEASNSLKNVYGDFISCLTDFYDCPPTWSRATKKDGKTLQLTNVCMNLLAGSTFDYLGKLVSDENIQGGFASRLIYVVSRNKEVKPQEFQLGGIHEKETAERKLYKEALIEDLTHISTMTGPMHANDDFGAAWEKWYYKFEQERRALDSEKLQSLMARVNTNLLKVSMLISAAESDSRELTLAHWERATELVLPVYEQVPMIFRQARANSSDKSPANAASAIMDLAERCPGIKREMLRSSLIARGSNSHVIEQTINALINMGSLHLGQDQSLNVFGKSNNHF